MRRNVRRSTATSMSSKFFSKLYKCFIQLGTFLGNQIGTIEPLLPKMGHVEGTKKLTRIIQCVSGFGVRKRPTTLPQTWV